MMLLKSLLFSILSFSYAVSQQQTVQKSVFVFRHCVRSTPTSAYSGIADFDDFQNFTNKTFPKWPVEVYQCLPKGLELLRKVGSSIASQLPRGVVQFEVDTSCKRDNDTANALLRGMNMKQDDYRSAPEIFDPISHGPCSPLNQSVIENAVKKRFETFPIPFKHRERLKRMQNVLGTGVAPPLDEISDFVNGAYLNGGSSVSSSFAEAFLMQLGASMEVAWGDITREDVYDFLTTHIYARGVTDRVPRLVSHSHTIMSNRIIQFFENKNESGTLILVGHDGDLDALSVMFDLKWHSEPFPPNATTPGSAIRFDLLVDTSQKQREFIQTSIYYQIFDGSGIVHKTPATFESSNSSVETFETVKSNLFPRLDSTCSMINLDTRLWR